MSGPEDGYFPRGSSVLRMVHEERAVGLFYGQRALGIGALAPLNFIGTANHTLHKDQPFKRLVRTAKMFESIFLGSKVEADRVLTIVAGMHDRVNGALDEQVGPYDAGTRYDAYDPDMMLWTMGSMADSALVFYELFVRPLSAAERDRFWADYVRFGALFGLPEEVAPESWEGFQSWFHGRIGRDDHFLTEQARETALATMFSIPTASSRKPGMAVHNVIVRGTLPRAVREKYGLSWSARDQLAFRAAVSAARASRVVAPDSALRGFNTAHFDGVAAAEQAIIARGGIPPGAIAA